MDGQDSAESWQSPPSLPSPERLQRLMLCETALEHAANAIAITDADGRIEWVNRAFSTLTGYAPEDVLGLTPSILKSGLQDAGFYQGLWECLRQGRPFAGMFVNRRKDGSIYQASQTITPVLDDNGAPSHFIAVQEDVTSEQEAERRLLHASWHDPLTGLPNRAMFLERLEGALARTTGKESLSVLALDLVHFGQVNDRLGHEAGDLVLRIVSARLAGVLSGGDLLARLGGDEFIILQQESGGAAAAALARRLHESLDEPISVAGIRVKVATRIGIAVSPGDGVTVESLLRGADLAMRHGKAEARSATRFYSAELDRCARERIELEAGLRSAIAKGELVLHYQPQIGLQSGTVAGMEALVRWNRPGHGLVLPGRFIPLAEQTGLIHAIGSFVLETAVAQAAQWRRAGSPVRVAINVSLAQFQDDGFCDAVEETLARHRLPPELLDLELTESVLASDADTALQRVRSLRRLGCAVSIDDFGTGYSSLSHLRRFQASCLKVDRSFLADDVHVVDSISIIKAIVGLAHELGLRVVAEGVETEGQARLVQQLGCDEGQGWLYGRPLPAALASELLTRRAA